MYGDPSEVLADGDVFDLIGETENEADERKMFTVRKNSLIGTQSGNEQGVYSFITQIKILSYYYYTWFHTAVHRSYKAHCSLGGGGVGCMLLQEFF